MVYLDFDLIYPFNYKINVLFHKELFPLTISTHKYAELDVVDISKFL